MTDKKHEISIRKYACDIAKKSHYQSQVVSHKH